MRWRQAQVFCGTRARCFQRRWGGGRRIEGRGEGSRTASIRTIVDAALADDPDALAAVERTGEWLGRGLVMVLAALNPEVVVVGTLGVVLGERLLAPARAILEAQAIPQAVAACTLMPAVLGPRIGDVAAIMAAVAGRDRGE